jgi:hypothetical protein
MAQVSIGQVENLQALVQGLLSVQQGLESACREQVDAVDGALREAREEAEASLHMLERATQMEHSAQHALVDAQSELTACQAALVSAQSAASACHSQGVDKDGTPPDCSAEEAAEAEAEADYEVAQAQVERAESELEQAKADRQAMEQRVELANQAHVMAEQLHEHARAECSARLAAVSQSVDKASARLTAAQQALNSYLETNPHAAQFYSWLKWDPAQHARVITPDMLRDRMNLSVQQQDLLQEYLYDRNPAYRELVDRYRSEWAMAKGDAERDVVARKTRIHLSGEFAEQTARYALAPLGGRVETQGRTYVGDSGRYTKTDLIVMDLRVPVILGRGDGMAVPAGGSLACEVKCGKADYLYQQRDHMEFQAEGHQHADASCTLCSRDIRDLPEEKETELRDALRKARSPLVGMLPRKNDVDKSCLGFIRVSNEDPQ